MFVLLSVGYGHALLELHMSLGATEGDSSTRGDLDSGAVLSGRMGEDGSGCVIGSAAESNGRAETALARTDTQTGQVARMPQGKMGITETDRPWAASAVEAAHGL